jgi:hypothetical protein
MANLASSPKVEKKYGMTVPAEPRKQAILYQRAGFLVDTMEERTERALEAALSGGTLRQAALAAGMTPAELTYMMKLGEAGHPSYGEFFTDMLAARAGAEMKLAKKQNRWALTDEGVKRGATERTLAALEKDSWVSDRKGEGSVQIGIGQVTIMTDFGAEEVVQHDFDDSGVVDAEIVEDENE